MVLVVHRVLGAQWLLLGQQSLGVLEAHLVHYVQIPLPALVILMVLWVLVIHWVLVLQYYQMGLQVQAYPVHQPAQKAQVHQMDLMVLIIPLLLWNQVVQGVHFHQMIQVDLPVREIQVILVVLSPLGSQTPLEVQIPLVAQKDHFRHVLHGVQMALK